MLGERIRSLRKQKKLTLEALAGEKLTKGMLSLIENNKAQPSMESLTYIAQQLEVDVADLLEDVSVQELRDILEKVEKLYNSKSENESANESANYQEIIALIEPYETKLTQGYEAARLLDIYSRCFYHEKKLGWEELLTQAANIYEQLNLSSRRTSISIFRGLVKFAERQYDEALATLLYEKDVLNKNFAYIDPLSQLDLDYHEAIAYFAVGDATSATAAISVMEKAINYSNEQRIFYRIDDLYRLACAWTLMSGETKKGAYYIKKLKQFGEFADDQRSLLFHDILSAEMLILESHAYEKAEKIMEQYETVVKERALFQPFIFLTNGKIAYGLGQYKEAVQLLGKVEISSYGHHPFDLALFYVKDAYLALAYLELGQTEQARQAAELAREQFISLPDSPYKMFANKTYEQINDRLANPADEEQK